MNIAGIDLSKTGAPTTGAAQVGVFSRPTLSANNLSAFLSLLNSFVEQIGLAKLEIRPTPAGQAPVPSQPKKTEKSEKQEEPENLERPRKPDNGRETPRSATPEVLTAGTIADLHALIQTHTAGQGVSVPRHEEPQGAHSLTTITTATAGTAASGRQAGNAGDIAFSLSLTYQLPARILQVEAPGPATVVAPKTLVSSRDSDASAMPEKLPAFKARTILEPETMPAGQKSAPDQKTPHNTEPRREGSVRQDEHAENPERPLQKKVSNMERVQGPAKSSQNDVDDLEVVQNPVEHWPSDFNEGDRAQGFKHLVAGHSIDESKAPPLQDRIDEPRSKSQAFISRTTVSVVTPTPSFMDTPGAMPTEQYDLHPTVSENGTLTNSNVLPRSPSASVQNKDPLQAGALISSVPGPGRPSGTVASESARVAVARASAAQIRRVEPAPYVSADEAVRGAEKTESGHKALRIPPVQKLAEARNTPEHLEAAVDSVSLVRLQSPAGDRLMEAKQSKFQAPHAPTVPAEKDAANTLQTHSIREISLRLSGAGAPHVDVQVADRAGKVQVAVRTADQNLAKSLQNNLSDLVGRLEQKGYKTDIWTPFGESHQSRGVTEPSVPTGNHGHPDDFGSRGGEPDSQQDQQGSNQQHQDRRRAHFDETLLASGVTS